MAITRRQWIGRAGALGATALVPGALGCSSEDAGDDDDGLPRYSYAGPLGPDTLFTHAVASGDPLPSAVILWTRVSPAPAKDAPAPAP